MTPPADNTHLDEGKRAGSRRATARRLLDLSGVWRVRSIDAELLRTGADPELDDSEWIELEVPGHWAEHETLADEDGPLLYRRRFTMPEAAVRQNGSEDRLGTRYWLRLDGVLSEAEVWLDGKYLGDTTGYFASHQFDVTDLLTAETDHLLALDIRCPPPERRRTMAAATDDGPRDKTALTGALQVGPLAPPSNPGGLWKPVTVDVSGPVAIRHARLLCTEATAEQASISLRLVLDASEATDVQLRATIAEVTAPDATGSTPKLSLRHQPLASGENRIEWTVPIDEPKLWWPSPLGEQPMYRVDLSVETTGERHSVSDQMTWQTGLRTVSADDMTWTVNGQRLFIKCLAYGPGDPFLGSMTVADMQTDLDLAVQAGFNAIRLVGHLARPELLELADEAGLLVWQDLPLIGGYSSKVQRSVKTLIREAVDAVGHHPSVIAWGGHCQPNGDAVARPDGDSVTDPARQIVRHFLPSWNRSFLDSIVGRELAAADPTRPVIARSGHLPSRMDQPTDSRLWLGWRTGRAGDATSVYDRWPRLAAFPSGIGAQTVSFPAAAETDDWVTAEFGSLTRYTNPRKYDDFASWANATEHYQQELIRSHIETVRLRKYGPSGGLCVTALADAEQWGGFGLVHFDRSPKPAFTAAALANRPVLAIIANPPLTVAANQDLHLHVHLLNDLFYGLESVRVDITAATVDGHVIAQEHWTVDAPADGVAAVGDLDLIAPSSGVLALSLRMVESGATVENLYRIPVVTPA